MDVELVNALMFRAESQQRADEYDGLSWLEFLDAVLADDFQLRRSAPDRPEESREAFLRATHAAEPQSREVVPGSVRVWQSGSFATVTCVVEVAGRPGRFTNTRVFSAGGRFGWRCHWWQVTAPADTG